MRIILDTNIVLDSLLSREPHNAAANDIFRLVGKEKVSAFINASSVTDIFYVLRKKFSESDSRIKIKMLLSILHAVEVTHDDCLAAVDFPNSDYEDALVAVCANKANIDFIITRDKEFLKISNAISPNEFLEKNKEI